MTQRRKELKTTLGELVDELRQDLGAHPDPEELLAYQAGKLSAAAESRLRDHLVLCPVCLELLLDSGCFADPEFGSGRQVSAAEMAAVWQGIRPRAAEAPGARILKGRFPRFPAPTSLRVPYALAAALLIAVVALSLWVASLRQTLGELSRPQLNTPLHDLYPASFVRSEDDAARGLQIPPEAKLVTLILNPTRPPSDAAYRVAIVEPDGTELWSAAGLEANPSGSFTLTVPRRFLDAGEWTLRLYGLADHGPELIEEYPLRIE